MVYAPTTTVGGATTLDLSGATTGNFKSGDKIEINLSKVTGISGPNSVTVTPPTGWAASSASTANSTPIILTKN